jgi:uncharacterized protein (DUF2252 family)
MPVSPFSFSRGTAKIMATDLDGTPTAGLQRAATPSVELRAVRHPTW